MRERERPFLFMAFGLSNERLQITRVRWSLSHYRTSSWLVFHCLIRTRTCIMFATNGLIGSLSRQREREWALIQSDRWTDTRTGGIAVIINQIRGIDTYEHIYTHRSIYVLCKSRMKTRARGQKNRLRSRHVRSWVLGIIKGVHRAQRLINLEIPVLVRSLKSSNVELG